jgi:hypothetical protein
VADRLEPGPLADAVLAYDEFLLAGAVSHDSGYYALGDPVAKAAADRLHGTGGHDSFAPFRALASKRDEVGAQGFAFGLGALTHLAADATFHPLVFSWTGDADAPEAELRAGWLYRHQACETALDKHLDALWGAPAVRTYAALARQGRTTLGQVHAVFSGADSGRWRKAHARLQRLFGHAAVGWAAQALAWRRRGGDGDWSAAFYRGGPARHPAFEGTLEWIDPVTGGPQHASLEQLVDRYEALALSLAAAWEKAWNAGSVPFSGKIGPALDTGLPCDKKQEKKYFSPRWF